MRPGDEFLALLKAGQNVAIDELLVSRGDGTFASASDSGTDENQAVVKALEALDLSGVGAVNTLVHVIAL